MNSTNSSRTNGVTLSTVIATTATHLVSKTSAVARGEAPASPARRQAKTIWAQKPIQTPRGKVLGIKVSDSKSGKSEVSVAIILNGDTKTSWRDASTVFAGLGERVLSGIEALMRG